MLQNSQISIHPSANAVFRARFLGSVESVGRDVSRNTFLEAEFGEVVDSYVIVSMIIIYIYI
jgi:hypothetical protein